MKITHVSFVHGATLLRAVASSTGKSPRIYFGLEIYAELHQQPDGRQTRVRVVREFNTVVVAEETPGKPGSLWLAPACRPLEMAMIADLDALVAEDPDLVLTTMAVVR
jgi:hypothetical protein